MNQPSGPRSNRRSLYRVRRFAGHRPRLVLTCYNFTFSSNDARRTASQTQQHPCDTDLQLSRYSHLSSYCEFIFIQVKYNRTEIDLTIYPGQEQRLVKLLIKNKKVSRIFFYLLNFFCPSFTSMDVSITGYC